MVAHFVEWSILYRNRKQTCIDAQKFCTQKLSRICGREYTFAWRNYCMKPGNISSISFICILIFEIRMLFQVKYPQNAGCISNERILKRESIAAILFRAFDREDGKDTGILVSLRFSISQIAYSQKGPPNVFPFYFVTLPKC